MKAHYLKPRFMASQPGFSLVEVLVALLVLSIGLLGLAALQTVSLKTGHESYLRTQATILAYDIVDRMRANRTEVFAGRYDVATGVLSTTINCVTRAAPCTTSELAKYDTVFWKNELSAKLPQGDGTITTIAGTPNQSTITVMWKENDLDMNLKLVVQI